VSPRQPSRTPPHAPPKIDVEGNPVRLIFGLARQLRALLDQRFAEADLSLAQAAVLVRSVQQQQPARATQLARDLTADAASMTRLLDRLEAKGLVLRKADPADRRAVFIVPTPAGRALVPRIAPVFGRTMVDLLRGLDENEIEAMMRGLQKARANIAEAMRG
jgi:DNA-binding MarR family transcriptional regulator